MQLALSWTDLMRSSPSSSGMILIPKSCSNERFNGWALFLQQCWVRSLRDKRLRVQKYTCCSRQTCVRRNEHRFPHYLHSSLPFHLLEQNPAKVLNLMNPNIPSSQPACSSSAASTSWTVISRIEHQSRCLCSGVASTAVEGCRSWFLDQMFSSVQVFE